MIRALVHKLDVWLDFNFLFILLHHELTLRNQRPKHYESQRKSFVKVSFTSLHRLFYRTDQDQPQITAFGIFISHAVAAKTTTNTILINGKLPINSSHLVANIHFYL